MRARTLAGDAGRTYANLRRRAAVAAEVGPPWAVTMRGAGPAAENSGRVAGCRMACTLRPPVPLMHKARGTGRNSGLHGGMMESMTLVTAALARSSCMRQYGVCAPAAMAYARERSALTEKEWVMEV
jgi:hypothetical protein